MLGIFQPTHLGCPVCNHGASSHVSYGMAAYNEIDGGRYKGRSCGHEFSLFDALQKQCQAGTFGILSVFSHWNWSSNQAVVVGRLFKIPVPIPSNVTLFAAFLTPYTSSDDEVDYIPRVLNLSGPELLISTTGVTTATPEQLGTEAKLNVAVYGFRQSESRGWARLLYESLTDHSEHKYTMAVFKLATSIEIALDRTFEIYLERKAVPDSLIQRLLRSGRSWSARAGRLCDIAPTFLASDELEAFQAAVASFQQAVRCHRNAFAHDDPDRLDYKAADEAFKTCFPIFWGIERMLAGQKPI